MGGLRRLNAAASAHDCAAEILRDVPAGADAAARYTSRAPGKSTSAARNSAPFFGFLGSSVGGPRAAIACSLSGDDQRTRRYVGQLVAEIERQGLIGNTLIVYTSDHGEMGGEHGLWTKFNLLENSARIPMIVAGAGFPHGKVVDTPVSAVDLTPTMLEVAGTRPASGLRGHSLLGLANGRSREHPGYAYSESLSEGNCTGSYMIRQGDWKYVHYTWYGDLLFNIKQDPGEFHNLAGNPAHRDVQSSCKMSCAG